MHHSWSHENISTAMFTRKTFQLLVCLHRGRDTNPPSSLSNANFTSRRQGSKIFGKHLKNTVIISWCWPHLTNLSVRPESRFKCWLYAGTFGPLTSIMRPSLQLAPFFNSVMFGTAVHQNFEWQPFLCRCPPLLGLLVALAQCVDVVSGSPPQLPAS
jgi:hypothetical protein